MFFIKMLTFLRILFTFENTIYEHTTNDLLTLWNLQTKTHTKIGCLVSWQWHIFWELLLVICLSDDSEAFPYFMSYGTIGEKLINMKI